jgi:hypothetical protein
MNAEQRLPPRPPTPVTTTTASTTHPSTLQRNLAMKPTPAWKRCATLLALTGLPWGAGAQSLSLTALPAALTVGQAFELRLDFDFSADPTLGGGVDLAYDVSLLQYTGFVFSPTLGDDPSFRRQPDAGPDRLVGLAFGNFNGLRGPGEVGRFSFTALAAGVASLNLEANVAPAGAFISLQTFSPQAVAFGSTQVQVSAVPELGQGWLAMAGLVGVAVLRCRRGRVVEGGAGR